MIKLKQTSEEFISCVDIIRGSELGMYHRNRIIDILKFDMMVRDGEVLTEIAMQGAALILEGTDSDKVMNEVYDKANRYMSMTDTDLKYMNEKVKVMNTMEQIKVVSNYVDEVDKLDKLVMSMDDEFGSHFHSYMCYSNIYQVTTEKVLFHSMEVEDHWDTGKLYKLDYTDITRRTTEVTNIIEEIENEMCRIERLKQGTGWNGLPA